MGGEKKMKKFIFLLIMTGIWALASIPVSANNTLQGLIDQTPKNGTLKLEGKTFEGNVTITKPITIIGENGTVIRGDGTGNVITIKTENVTLERLTIEHGGLSRSSEEEFSGIRSMGDNNKFFHLTIRDVFHGIYINNAKENHVKDVTITGQGEGELGSQGNGIQLIRTENNLIEDCTISNTRDGIFVEFADNNIVNNNVVSDTRYGLHYMYSNQNTFHKNKFIKNIGGAAIMHSENIKLEDNQFSFNQGSRSFGLIIQSSKKNHINNNEFYLNQRGIYLDQSTQNRITGNKFFRNDIGVELWTSSTAQVFTGNHFNQNVASVLTIGGESINQWNENGRGNYWGGGQTVFDLNQDQIGDAPVEYKSSLYKLVEENELTYLFLKSPAIGIYEKMNELLSSGKTMALDQFPLIENQERKVVNGYLFLPLILIFIGLIMTKKRKGS